MSGEREETEKLVITGIKYAINAGIMSEREILHTYFAVATCVWCFCLF